MPLRGPGYYANCHLHIERVATVWNMQFNLRIALPLTVRRQLAYRPNVIRPVYLDVNIECRIGSAVIQAGPNDEFAVDVGLADFHRPDLWTPTATRVVPRLR